MALLGFFVVIAVGRRRSKHGAPGATTMTIEVDDVGARRTLADGRVEQLTWDELTRVEVVHATRGVHAAAGGVVMLAGDDANGCLVPMDRIGDVGLLDQLARQPGFPVDVFVQALQDPKGPDVVCWTRPADEL